MLQQRFTKSGTCFPNWVQLTSQWIVCKKVLCMITFVSSSKSPPSLAYTKFFSTSDRCMLFTCTHGYYFHLCCFENSFTIKFTVLTLSLPKSNLESINVAVPFESVDETLMCDHSNESYRAILSNGTVCFWQFCKLKYKIFPSVLNLALLGVKGLILQYY